MSGWSGASTLHAEAGTAVVYKGMMDCFARTLKEEGVSALFKVSSRAACLVPVLLNLMHWCIVRCMAEFQKAPTCACNLMHWCNW